MIVLIDNYDSFVYNLCHYVQEAGAEVTVVRHDAISVNALAAMQPQGIILSPGPCTPDEAGICLDVVTQLGKNIPIFGVCLGHQTIGQVFGGHVVRGKQPMHGKVSVMERVGESDLFDDVPSHFEATRYHSLVVNRDNLPDCFKITAQSDDGVIQAMEHKHYPLYGVQFHPESIASQYGHTMLQNFLTICNKRSA